MSHYQSSASNLLGSNLLSLHHQGAPCFSHRNRIGQDTGRGPSTQPAVLFTAHVSPRFPIWMNTDFRGAKGDWQPDDPGGTTETMFCLCSEGQHLSKNHMCTQVCMCPCVHLSMSAKCTCAPTPGHTLFSQEAPVSLISCSLPTMP